MAVVLGQELDVFLRGIGEDLKGKVKVNYVDQETIIRACSAQNQVILTLQEQILQMKEVERGMQRTLDMLQEKVEYFEKYTKKVDAIEDIMSEKIPLVDKMNEVVKEHDADIDRHGMRIDEQGQAMNTFREQTRKQMLEAAQGITNLRSQVNLLPKTIVISSRQVTHSLDDESKAKPAITTAGDKVLLVDIIAQQEQHAYLQDEHTKEIEGRLDDHVTQQNGLNAKIGNDVNNLMDWKVAQSSVDLVTMRSDQDSMQTELERQETQLSTKMSKQDVNQKLDLQFKEIVDHLHSALMSVEKDEADFNSITDTLSKMCQTLRENKADRSELSALRKQFIEDQIDLEEDTYGGIRSGGSSLSNEAIRKAMEDHPTKEDFKKMLSAKMDRKIIIPEIVKMNTSLQSLEGVVQMLISASSDDAVRKQEASMESRAKLMAHESLFSINDLDGDGDSDDADTTSGRVRDAENTPKYPLHQAAMKAERAGRTSVATKRKKRGPTSKDSKFPSSNILGASLSKIPPNENGLKLNDSFLTGQPLRPSSAPITQDNTTRKPLSKKHSLPEILTSISKTMRPALRAKTNSKKGKYGIPTRSKSELDKSSSHFSDL